MSRTKTTKSKPKPPSFLHTDPPATTNAKQPCIPPQRIHALTYHTPLLLHHEESSRSLLAWFDGIAQQRAMPWRKPWTESISKTSQSATTARIARSTRAYEVWISEIMLQQTRVSTVIPFYNNWLSKWPTVDSLAQASQDEVLSAWKGLGYYSRATRLHEAAQQIVRDLGKEIPADVEGLLRIKGIGRYTAGAVSSIAFGRAVPLLDGNVSRVLSRQMGLYAQVKDKKVEDILWDAAKALVERISGHSGEEEESSIPGRWNQGLMELGSTICIPKNPKCIECPIRSTCRAYSEGMALVESNRPQTQEEQGINDIEDACCTLCLHLASEDLPVRKTKENHKKRPAEALPSSTRVSKRAAKQSTLDALFFTRPKQQQQQLVIKAEEKTEKAEEIQIEEIPAYCSLFPARDAKKAVPTQDCLVCIIQRRPRSNSRAARGKKSTTVTTQSESENANANASKGAMYLIEQRPEKGLLANLWQFPNVQLVSSSLPEDKKTRSEQARG
ncbi:MAG: hypothetical protein GOMPHAMPRED_006515, partial [Gomphillus americanus]